MDLPITLDITGVSKADSSHETQAIQSHHSIFIYLFLLMSFSFMYRMYLHINMTSRSKISVMFYTILAFTSLLRSLWFYLFSFSNIYYLPLSDMAIYDYGSRVCFLSQMISCLGDILLYLNFILIICYWYQIL